MVLNYQKIYERLGYLYYALAAADKHMMKKESEILKKLIDKEWIPLEDSTDEFGTDAANYIYFTFDSLVDRDYPPKEAFQAFKEYFELHENAFDSNIRKKIEKTALLMADAFTRENRTEAFFIKELKKLLHRKRSLVS